MGSVGFPKLPSPLFNLLSQDKSLFQHPIGSSDSAEVASVQFQDGFFLLAPLQLGLTLSWAKKDRRSGGKFGRIQSKKMLS